jgi:hypothetical protein
MQVSKNSSEDRVAQRRQQNPRRQVPRVPGEGRQALVLRWAGLPQLQGLFQAGSAVKVLRDILLYKSKLQHMIRASHSKRMDGLGNKGCKCCVCLSLKRSILNLSNYFPGRELRDQLNYAQELPVLPVQKMSRLWNEDCVGSAGWREEQEQYKSGQLALFFGRT